MERKNDMSLGHVTLPSDCLTTEKYALVGLTLWMVNCKMNDNLNIAANIVFNGIMVPYNE